jgi:GAF domain-containing protein
MGVGVEHRVPDAAYVALLEKIAMATSLPDALREIVELVEKRGDGLVCSILLLAGDGTLRHGAAPHLPPEFLRAIDGLHIGAEEGSCGAAAARRERVVVEDIATHPWWTKYKGAALRHGFVACWSTPILSPKREVLGTFAMYYRERRGPRPGEIEWVSAGCHLAAIAIGT